MSSKIPLESAIILIIGSSDELAAEHETMDMCGHTELRGHPRPRPLKSVAGTFHGKRAGFISPIYFPEGKLPPSGDFAWPHPWARWGHISSNLQPDIGCLRRFLQRENKKKPRNSAELRGFEKSQYIIFLRRGRDSNPRYPYEYT